MEKAEDLPKKSSNDSISRLEPLKEEIDESLYTTKKQRRSETIMADHFTFRTHISGRSESDAERWKSILFCRPLAKVPLRKFIGVERSSLDEYVVLRLELFPDRRRCLRLGCGLEIHLEAGQNRERSELLTA